MSREELVRRLNYDPSSGVFTWRTRPARSNCVPGNVAGSILTSPTCHGYRRISLNDRSYLAHRLAWLYVNGAWPTKQLDHINGNRDDNRLINLREASNAENGRNRKRGSNNKSGHVGVRQRKGAWESYIKCGQRSYYLGRFGSIEKAVAAREAKSAELFGEFARRSA